MLPGLVGLVGFMADAGGGPGPGPVAGLVTDGDSITQGFGRYPTYPDLVMADTGTKVTNIAVSGRQLFEMDDEFATETAPYVTEGTTLIVLGGINDIRAHGADDTDLQTWIQSYCGKASSAGFTEIWVCTLMPCSSSWDSTKEGYRDNYNTWLRANYGSFADGLIDFEAETELSDSTDTTYFADGLHPTHQGLRVMANTVKTALSYSDLSFDHGTLCFNEAQSISAATVTVVDWAETLIDDHNLFVVGSPEVLTIPSGLNGRYGRFIANQRRGTEIVTTFTKNGSYFVGAAAFADATSAGNCAVNAKTPPVVLATGDLFRSQHFGAGGGTLPNDQRNWFAFELLPSSFNGALVTHTSSQSLSGGALAFNSETGGYDLDGWHDNSTNNSRLTVPSGVSRVRVCAGVMQNSTSSVLEVSITKNGASFRGMAKGNVNTGGADGVNIATAIVDVTPGDYFEVVATGGTAPANTIWFSIEAVDTYSGALVYLSGTQSVSVDTATPVAFDTEVHDVGGWFDSANGGAFIIPSGVYRIQVSGNLTGGGSNFGPIIFKNGVEMFGGPIQDTTAGTESANILSGVLPVVPGDEISLIAWDSSGVTLNNDEANWFSIRAFT